MGQLSTKYQTKAAIYDFSIDGGATGAKPLNISIKGGQNIVAVRYTMVTTMVGGGVIDCGFGFNTGTGFVNPADTVAVLNAAVGFWKTYIPAGGFRRINVQETLDFNIYFSNTVAITAGRFMIAIDTVQLPI